MATNSRANSADAIQICGPIVDHETTLQRCTHLGFLCRHNWEICSAGSSPDTLDPSGASVSNPILACPSKRTTPARHPNRRLLPTTCWVETSGWQPGKSMLKTTADLSLTARSPRISATHEMHSYLGGRSIDILCRGVGGGKQVGLYYGLTETRLVPK